MSDYIRLCLDLTRLEAEIVAAFVKKVVISGTAVTDGLGDGEALSAALRAAVIRKARRDARLGL